LIPQTAVFRRDALAWQWEVNVETSDQINAYCAAGGKIMVFTGLIEQLKLSDDELAAVMGHEMAHALREHSREQMGKAQYQQLGAQVLSVLTGGRYDQGIGAAMKLTEVAYNLPHSREHESEADAIGLELAARAGYDPRAAVTLWQKMAAASKGAPPQFLSTHPSDDKRQADIEALLPKVLPLYEAAHHS
jgi:predicted Zn-dependent protease